MSTIKPADPAWAVPEFGEEIPAAHPSAQALSMMAKRRSTMAMMLGEPGPDSETLDRLLTIAARVPDHRKVVPFRFITFEGDQRAAFSEVLLKAAHADDEHLPTTDDETTQKLFTRAGVVVAVISSVNHEHKTPEWEQVLTAGAVCQNLLIAASAAGFAGQWLTEWTAYNRVIIKALGLEAHERIAGFVYLGTAKMVPRERPRPALDDLRTRWSPTTA